MNSDSTSLTPGHAPHAREAGLAPALMEALELSREGVLLIDAQWRIFFANSLGREIGRLHEGDISTPGNPQRTVWEIYPEAVGTTLESGYRRAVSEQRAVDLDDFFYAPFSLWMSARAVPMAGGLCVFLTDITQRRYAEEKRKSAEDSLQFAFEASNGVGSFTWRVPEDRVTANERFGRLHGVDAERAEAGIPVAEFMRNIHPDDRQRVRAQIDGTLQTGEPFSSDYRLLQADGTYRWLAVRGRCRFDGHGKPHRFTGIAIDITDQRERESSLRESEERYRVLTELSPQAQWTADAEGRVLYANQRFLDYIGHDFDPGDGNAYISCFAPEDRVRVGHAWAQSIRSGTEYSVEARLLRASDGAARWWHVQAAPVRGADGTIKQWLGLADDIHDRRLADERMLNQYAEIDRQHHELRAIYRSSPVGLCLYGLDFRVQRVNDFMCDTFQLDRDAVLGKHVDQVFPQAGHILQMLARALAGETVRGEPWQLDTGAGKRYFSENYSPVFDDEGLVESIASAVVEITQIKRIEAALIQSEKLAAVGRMASSIAHEINNPLESVMNLIYLARTGPAPPEVVSYLDLADQELRRVANIASQTLRFHRQSTRPREISCDQLFGTSLSIYEGRLRNSNIEVEKRKRCTLPVVCYEGEIRQVLSNLVSNAIDAMPSGGRLILRSRQATNQRSGEQGMLVTIADTGMGMSEEARKRVFEAFFTTKGIGGSGLGLWISAEIVNRHNGSIHVRSRVPTGDGAAHGTVIEMFLPFKAVIREQESF
jgi:PAS domain S-box-containing protein